MVCYSLNTGGRDVTPDGGHTMRSNGDQFDPTNNSLDLLRGRTVLWFKMGRRCSLSNVSSYSV